MIPLPKLLVLVSLVISAVGQEDDVIDLDLEDDLDEPPVALSAADVLAAIAAPPVKRDLNDRLYFLELTVDSMCRARYPLFSFAFVCRIRNILLKSTKARRLQM